MQAPEVIVILGEGMEKAREYADGIGLPFPILCRPRSRGVQPV
jgi:hypothetical protein